MSRPTRRALGAVATTATALAAGALLSPAAHAATGHACTVNGGAAGCASGSTVSGGSALTFNDVGSAAADDFTLSAGSFNARCTRVLGTASLVNDGGAAYPLGGAGASVALTSLTLDNGTPFTKCTGVLAGTSVTYVITLQDSNGSGVPGLADGTTDWNAGAPRLTFHNVDLKLDMYVGSTVAWKCSFRVASLSGAVTNNAAGRVNFTGQPFVKTGGMSYCPTSGTISFPVNLVRTGGSFYVSA